jgi:hypothetical protein
MIAPAAIPEALAEAARWRLLGLLLERPRSSWNAEVAGLVREVDDATLAAVSTRALAAREGEYLALLGPGGVASPREAGHCGFGDPGWVLSELARHYEAFGYFPRTEDPLDHVAVEVGFVAYLHMKEALALLCADEEAASVTRDARQGFLAGHLATIATPLAAALDGAPSYLVEVVHALAARVPPGARREAADVDPLAGGCGACGLR